MRVLQLGSTAYNGGVTNAVKGLCLSLRRLGHEVALYTDGGDLSVLRDHGVEAHLAELWQKPGPLLRSTIKLRRLINAFRPDIVHVHGRSVALRAFLAGRKADWFTLHNTHLTHTQGFYDVGFVRRHFSPWGKRFFVLDELADRYLQDEFGVRSEAIVHIQNGVDTRRYRPPTVDERAQARAAFHVTPLQTFVAFVGRLHPSKQPEAVVAAAAGARDRDDVRFAIVGEGELHDAVAKQIVDTGASRVCTMHSWMDPLSVYWAADLVVMPSLFEGYGLVAAESIAAGTPVLRSRTGGSGHMIHEGVSGFMCEPAADAFVSRLGEVLDEPNRLVAMRATARAFALQHLDVDIATARIVDAYSSRL